MAVQVVKFSRKGCKIRKRLSKSMVYVKNHRNLSQFFFSLKNTNLGADFLILKFLNPFITKIIPNSTTPNAILHAGCNRIIEFWSGIFRLWVNALDSLIIISHQEVFWQSLGSHQIIGRQVFGQLSCSWATVVRYSSGKGWAIIRPSFGHLSGSCR